jgi:hypothetical protein
MFERSPESSRQPAQQPAQKKSTPQAAPHHTPANPRTLQQAVSPLNAPRPNLNPGDPATDPCCRGGDAVQAVTTKFASALGTRGAAQSDRRPTQAAQERDAEGPGDPGRANAAAELAQAATDPNHPTMHVNAIGSDTAGELSATVNNFLTDKRNPDDSPTNAESALNAPADLSIRMKVARKRATKAAGANQAGTFAVGGAQLPNGWSNEDLTVLNVQYSIAGLHLDTPGGQNDPRSDQGNLRQNRGNKHLPIVQGGAAASHAEQLVAIADGLNGNNESIGVSRQQCGGCREWFREHAMQQQQTYVVADPKLTRVYYPNGDVSIHDLGGTLIKTVNEKPSVGLRNYEDVLW